MEKQLIDEKIKEFFLNYKTIAIVGVSPDAAKDSNKVMKFLIDKGYKVFPVNPKTEAKNIHDKEVYKSLSNINEKIEIVNVFRPSNEAVEIAKQTKDIGAKVFWLQLNIDNQEAAKIVSTNKIFYVSNKCTKIEYERLFKESNL
tara:strand:+ start:9942 stop:10373 length:432 start_codon:yes stop_codon:yes gene_type:complete